MPRISRKWAYVLSDIGRPTPPPLLTTPISPEDKTASERYDAIYSSWRENASLRSIGVTLHAVTVEEYDLFAFTIGNGDAEDSSAQRFADAALATLNLIHGPTFDESPVALRIPASLLKSKRLTFKALWTRQALDQLGQPFDGLTMQAKFGRCVYVTADVLTSVWELLPLTTKDPFFDAIHYYDASTREFCFLGDDIAEVLADDPSHPVSRRDAARAETAVQNAFKAIEALIGEPPRDDRKLRVKLEKIGVDPDWPIGWQWFGHGPAKEPILSKIRTIHEARDKRAAHGKTPRKRPLTYYEIMDCQGCARAMLLRALQAKSANKGARN